MKSITLSKKFSGQIFMMSIKVFYVTTHSSKSYELRNTHSIKGTAWNIAVPKKVTSKHCSNDTKETDILDRCGLPIKGG